MKRVSYIFLVLLLAACRKSDDGPVNPVAIPVADPTVIGHPVAINLYPAYAPSSGWQRLYMPIMQIGTKAVSIKTVFDTGSEGLVLSATAVLPPNLIADDGIVLNNPDSLVADGITITAVKDSAIYNPGPDERIYYGNIAYADVKMGDVAGNVVGRRVPFLLVYKGIYNRTGAKATLNEYPVKGVEGVLGVLSAYTGPYNGIVANRRSIKSPLSYCTYSGGVSPGLMLNSLKGVHWEDVNYQSGNNGMPLLTVGVTREMESSFALITQQAIGKNYYKPSVMGEIDYQDNGITFTPVLFDTGFGNYIHIYDLFGVNQDIADGVKIKVSTDNGGVQYSYITDRKVNRTSVINTGDGRSVLGIPFFRSNAYLLDYAAHYIGFKADN